MKRLSLFFALFAGLAGGDAIAQEGGSDRYGVGESGAKPVATMFGGSEPKPESSVRIFRLEKMDAEEVAKVLKEIMGPGERITAYPRTNSLVIHATEEQHAQIEKLLGHLGEQNENAPAKRASALPLGELRRLYASSEKQAADLAAKYREAATRQKPGSMELKLLGDHLLESVTESFQYRQDQHRAEIAELEEKIRKMKSLLDAREKIKDEIIDRRVADLKNPNRRWEETESFPGIVRNRTSLTSKPGPAPRRLQGVVTAVRDEDKFVEISLGADDGVKQGTTFNVIRQGLHVGQAEVVEVIPDRAIGRVIQEDLKLAPAKVGDQIEVEPARIPAGGSPIGLPGPAVLPMRPMGSGIPPGGTSNRTPPAEASLQLNLAGPKMATVLWTDSNKIPSYAVILPGRITVPSDGEAIFRLENLPKHPNLELFGSFANQADSLKAKTYVRHNAVSVEFTDEDVERAAAGNLVTKVFYIAEDASGINVIASTKVDPADDILKTANEKGDLLGVLRLGNRRAEIGEDEDWHEKWLRGGLRRIEAEREPIEEELAVFEETLIESSEKSREDILQKIAELKENLVQIDRRKEVYEQKLREHAESKGGTKAKAEKPAPRR